MFYTLPLKKREPFQVAANHFIASDLHEGFSYHYSTTIRYGTALLWRQKVTNSIKVSETIEKNDVND